MFSSLSMITMGRDGKTWAGWVCPLSLLLFWYAILVTDFSNCAQGLVHSQSQCSLVPAVSPQYRHIEVKFTMPWS